MKLEEFLLTKTDKTVIWFYLNTKGIISTFFTGIKKYGGIIVIFLEFITILFLLSFFIHGGVNALIKSFFVNSPAALGNIGSFIGGIIGPITALFSVILLVITFSHQKKSFLKAQIEARVFELLKIHKQNVADIRQQYQAEKKELESDYFESVFNEFNTIYKRVSEFIGRIPWFEHEMNAEKVMQLSYIIFFYGFHANVNNEVSNNSFQVLLSKGVEIVGSEKRELLKKILKQLNGRYRGQQSYLSNYYRHYFQTVNYINDLNPKIISFSEKYAYVKTLRAQMNNFEQALFMINSLTPLGSVWEIKHPQNEINKRLITKYNLLKNLPEGMIKDIPQKLYYPDVDYEVKSLSSGMRDNFLRMYI